MSRFLYPKTWEFFLDELIPNRGDGFRPKYLEQKFDALVDKLLDEDCMDDSELHTVINSQIIQSPIIENSGSDRVYNAMDDIVGRVVRETFKAIFEEEIAPHKPNYSESDKEDA
jgi:hypothetical protein